MRTPTHISAFFVLCILAGGAISAPAPVKKKDTSRTVKYGLKDKTWREVFEWFTKKTGKPFITDFYPQGKFTLEGPADKEYTIPELIDVFNEALLTNDRAQKYYIINRERSFTLLQADGKMDKLPWPCVRREDLVKHGNTELVSIVVPLTLPCAEDVAPKVKRMMGPFGEAIPVCRVGVNNLILLDSVGNLKRILKVIEQEQWDNPKVASPPPGNGSAD